MTVLLLISISCNQTRNKGYYYDITEYGAIPGDDQLDTHAIQKAIDPCAISRGGPVQRPPGAFTSGSLPAPAKLSLPWASGSKLQ
ncbi:MAG: hypothetical protein AAFN93_17980, partial [Bacteroidota bacterium]